MPVLGQRRCLLGCEDGLDRWPHYLACPRLLHLLARPRLFLPSCPLARLGLGLDSDYDSQVTRETAHRLVVLSFHFYHKLKAEHEASPSRCGDLEAHLRLLRATKLAISATR
eukprot:6137372-Pyramimonas_sp.AAC.1